MSDGEDRGHARAYLPSFTMPGRSRRAFLAGLVGSLPLVAACGSLPLPFAATPTPSAPRKVQVALPDPAFYQLYQIVSARLHNVGGKVAPGYRIEVVDQPVNPVQRGSAPTSAAELAGRYASALNALSGPNRPDLVVADPSTLAGLASAKAIRELDPFLKTAPWLKTDDFYGNVLDAGRLWGKQYTLPIEVGLEHVVYNRALFRRQNLPAPDPTWTWEQLLATAQKLTTPASGTDSVWGMFVTPSAPSFLTLAWQQGAEVLNADASQIDLTEAGTIRGMELLVDLIATRKVAPPVPKQLPPAQANVFLRAFYAQASQFFESLGTGHAAMGGGFEGWVLGGPASEDVGYATVPTGNRRVVLGVAGLQLGVAANAPDPDAAFRALQGIVEASNQATYLPARKGDANLRSVRSSLMVDDASALLATLPTVRFLPGGFPLDLIPVIQQEFVLPSLTGQKTPTQAAHDARPVVQQKLTELLPRPTPAPGP